MTKYIILFLLFFTMTGCQWMPHPAADKSIAKNARVGIGETDQSNHALESHKSSQLNFNQTPRAAQVNNNIDTYHISDSIWVIIVLGVLFALSVLFFFCYCMTYSIVERVATRVSKQTPSYLSEHLQHKVK